ncbi:MAG: helix-turn-helix domain-containing protein [Jiangellaceae bacterium]
MWWTLHRLLRQGNKPPFQAWARPLIVDGIIVVSTVAVVALAGQRSAWYPWLLLMAGALVSVTANALHAVVAADADVPGVLAACVAAVPPLVLLAITHLTVVLTRPLAPASPERAGDPAAESAPGPGRREVAVLLRHEGWSNKAIARHVGVHPSTVGRWFATRPALTGPDEEETA